MPLFDDANCLLRDSGYRKVRSKEMYKREEDPILRHEIDPWGLDQLLHEDQVSMVKLR